jgi:hypothetical protein
MMSDVDDKDDPNFFFMNEDSTFSSLPVNVKRAIENGKLKAKHSDFYYRLTDLNMKIGIYNKFFRTRIPKYQLAYILQKMERNQGKQEKQKNIFD